MAHQQQHDFFVSVKNRFPKYFKDVRVIDIGSLDINGNLRVLFSPPYYYVGLDLDSGPNVDIICPAHLYRSEFKFDTVVSAECLEHDMYYVRTLNNMIDLLRPGGMMIFSCASEGRHEHGTLRTTPENAPFLAKLGEDWANYYKNLTEKDIRSAVDIDGIFSDYEFSYQTETFDLYFWGIKR